MFVQQRLNLSVLRVVVRFSGALFFWGLRECATNLAAFCLG